MATMKHNFTYLNTIENPLWAGIVEVNEATSGTLIYGFLVLIFVVSVYVIANKTQDIGKSLVTGLHITTVLAIILFYAGQVGGYTMVAPIILLGLLVLEAFSIAGIKFMRAQGF